MNTTDKVLFCIYALHLIFAFGFLFPEISQGVREQCLKNRNCARHFQSVSFGYGEYSIDHADGQWREFRRSLPILFGACVSTSLASFLLRNGLRNSSPRTQLNAALLLRLLIGAIILFVQHGYHGGIVVSIALIGFFLTKFKLNGWEPIAAWAYAIAVLFFKESYRIKHLPNFQFLAPLFDRRYGGMYSWQLPCNFLVLRVISFSLDKYWAHRDAAQSKRGDDKPLGSPPTDTATTVLSSRHPSEPACALPLEQYSLLQYMAYVLYAPLYVAGPVITFNSFVRCLTVPSASADPSTKAKVDNRDAASLTGVPAPAAPVPAVAKENVSLYAVRWAATLALMEFLLTRYPFFAVAASGLLSRLTPAQTAVVSYLLLKLMWLKFLLLWRFFRLWALLDGVNPPENMIRCMSNNHSLEGFWRGWHSSFNKFLVRYLYLPLGGKARQMYTVWVIFVFVALWHDMEWKLLVWGGANAFFYALEVSLKSLMRRSGVLERLPAAVSAVLCAMGGAVYIMVLISVNLVGYGVGVGGVSSIWSKIVSPEGVQTATVCLYYLSIGVLIMQFMKRMGWTADA